ncbi:MAG: hypothetical protein H6818_05050 [Phycisphaerales bacterium]|nr:hypothetical protein [Phycisphaerales bacterium]MCB9863448.1 hypothetical protein [Phycisphaerales bacterium]
MKHPECGKCGYDLTGCEGNRCPECGQLLIEAGVTVRGKTARERLLGLARLLLILLFGIAGGVASYAYLDAKAGQQLAASQQQVSTLARELGRMQAKMMELKLTYDTLRLENLHLQRNLELVSATLDVMADVERHRRESN